MSDLSLEQVLDLVDDVQRRQRAAEAYRAASEALACGLQLARLHHGARAAELARCTGLSRREVARLLRTSGRSAL